MAKAHFEESLKFLKKDVHLGSFVIKHGAITHRRKHAGGAFQSLAEAIIFQQLSGKAAGTILKRFVALFPGTKFPTPEQVLKVKTEELRTAGLSGQKSGYLKDLSQKFKEGTINPKLFNRMSDAEITEHVVAVKGIGEWTAHMFLMFTLHRPDVLPVGDLGIQKGFQKLFKLRTRPSPAKMEKLAKQWAGHRTLACMYLWRYVDGPDAEW
ncbi:MAG TPA: DNA-3-methyladenine glycosylase [Candidatus Paceibacterota bacterium]|jgi:DNA-3-methyladenine glycosylase II|nr:DNA-3-methyladenine glycosylase [Candidatus Paceibacterota bacterium]